MESKQTTLKQLAADNEIPYADLKKYACENGWYAQKRRALKKKRKKTKPFENTKLSQTEKINEIAENENMSANKVKYAISNALKIITNNIPEEDKKTISEMLR